MFGKAAADLLGLSDIGSVIKPENFDKVDSDDYVLHEDGEKIFFLIKSKTDEYCFTNFALIHLDGTSAMSKKRLLKRFDYKTNQISHVNLETAGTIDMDIEIKFMMGENSYSIDVAKKFIEELKDLYKSLVKIASIQHENELVFGYAENSLQIAANAVNRSTSGATLDEQFKAVNQYTFEWLRDAHKTYMRNDYGEVYDTFIKN